MTKPGFRKTRDDVFGPSAATTLKSAGTNERRKKKRVIISSLCATSVTSSNGNGLLMITVAPILKQSRNFFIPLRDDIGLTIYRARDFASNAWYENVISWWSILVSSISSRNTKRSLFLARYCKIMNASTRATRIPIANSYFLFEWSYERYKWDSNLSIFCLKSGK